MFVILVKSTAEPGAYMVISMLPFGIIECMLAGFLAILSYNSTRGESSESKTFPIFSGAALRLVEVTAFDYRGFLVPYDVLIFLWLLALRI